MTSPDLTKARAYLERAEAWLNQLPGYPVNPEHAAVAAAIGTGYAVLASAPSELPPALVAAIRRTEQAAEEARPHDGERAPSGSLAGRLIAIANAVYGNDTGNVLDAPTGHGLAAVVRELGEGPLIQTEWAAAQFRKLADELEIVGGGDRG